MFIIYKCIININCRTTSSSIITSSSSGIISRHSSSYNGSQFHTSTCTFTCTLILEHLNTCTLVHTTFTQYCTYSYCIYTCLYTIYTYILLYLSHLSTYHCIFGYLFTFTTCCMHQYITNNDTFNGVVNLTPGLCMSKEKIKLCTSLLGCVCPR